MADEDHLAVIAACLALPVIREEIRRLDSHRPSGNTPSAAQAWEEITKRIEPLDRRRQELLDIITRRGYDRST